MWARMLLCATASAMLSVAAFGQSEPVASQIVAELWSPKTAIQILAGSAVITALINAIWFAVSSFLQRLQQWWNAKSTVYPVAFSRGMTRAVRADQRPNRRIQLSTRALWQRPVS